jgi:hypothetical protein
MFGHRNQSRLLFKVMVRYILWCGVIKNTFRLIIILRITGFLLFKLVLISNYSKNLNFFLKYDL